MSRDGIYHDPFESKDDYFSDEELIGFSWGSVAPYAKMAGGALGSMFGQPQQQQGSAAASAAATAQLAQLAQMQAAQQQQDADRARRASEDKTRTILYVVGGVAGLGLIGGLVYFLTKKK